MLRILRQLNPDEMRQVALHSRARPGATPEEVIRCLARLCGVTTWGIFPAGTDDILLDHVGRRLGMAPLLGGPHAIANRERAILACYLRQAWDAADLEQRRAVLGSALAAWDTAPLPRAILMEDSDSLPALNAGLEMLLQHSAGCRSIAVATETDPLPYPSWGPMSPGAKITVGRGAVGHQALYEVLVILWRARARLLRDRRTQRAQLERQVRQLETLLTVRQRDLSATPATWEVNPASGLSVVAAAAASVAVHLAIAPVELLNLMPAALAATAGLAWSATAATLCPRPSADQRITRMSTQIQTFRSQLAVVERDVHTLETE